MTRAGEAIHAAHELLAALEREAAVAPATLEPAGLLATAGDCRAALEGISRALSFGLTSDERAAEKADAMTAVLHELLALLRSGEGGRREAPASEPARHALSS